MNLCIQSRLKNLISSSLTSAIFLISFNALSAEQADSIELPPRPTQQASRSSEDCVDDKANCDMLTLSQQHNDMATYTRYRGKVDWNNAYQRFGYGDSLRFQKITKLDWEQGGDGGRSFDVFKKEPGDDSKPDRISNE